jgi:predicted metal-dependent hydrolase
VTARSVVVGRDGRAKAYRPLPEAARAAALEAGLAAYEQGDFFEAHELLEPAWMGTDVPADRALLQGLIKLAAAYVHAVRGNPAGIVRNLEGARARLVEAEEDRRAAGLPDPWLDLPGLVSAIDLRLADLAAHPNGPTLGPPELARSVP